jgi:hypothetical protein
MLAGMASIRRASAEPSDGHWTAVRSGWYLGSDELKSEMLALASGRLGPQHEGPERQESSGGKAERLLREGLGRLKRAESDLARHAKGDVNKLRTALRLPRETTMTLGWIAQRLRMGSWTYVSNLLCNARGQTRACVHREE